MGRMPSLSFEKALLNKAFLVPPFLFFKRMCDSIIILLKKDNEMVNETASNYILERANRIVEHLAPQGDYQSPSEEDITLINTAMKTLATFHNKENKKFRDRHFVVAAVLTDSGKTLNGINIKVQTTVTSICAEGNAISNAIFDNPSAKIVAIVIVKLHPKEVKSPEDPPSLATPCGRCRELLIDITPNAYVLIDTEAGIKRFPVRKLLPHPYKG